MIGLLQIVAASVASDRARTNELASRLGVFRGRAAIPEALRATVAILGTEAVQVALQVVARDGLEIQPGPRTQLFVAIARVASVGQVHQGRDSAKAADWPSSWELLDFMARFPVPEEAWWSWPLLLEGLAEWRRQTAVAIGDVLAVQQVDPATADPSVQLMIRWLTRRIALGDPPPYPYVTTLADWWQVAAGRGWTEAQLMNLGVPAMLDRAAAHAGVVVVPSEAWRAWAVRVAEWKRRGERPISEPVVMRFPGGWTLVQLEVPRQFHDESELMDHCVGRGAHFRGFWSNHESRSCGYYSLRDHEGFPRITFEIALTSAGRWASLRQSYGPQNTQPDVSVVPMLLEVFAHFEALPRLFLQMVRPEYPAFSRVLERPSRLLEWARQRMGQLDPEQVRTWTRVMAAAPPAIALAWAREIEQVPSPETFAAVANGGEHGEMREYFAAFRARMDEAFFRSVGESPDAALACAMALWVRGDPHAQGNLRMALHHFAVAWDVCPAALVYVLLRGLRERQDPTWVVMRAWIGSDTPSAPTGDARVGSWEDVQATLTVELRQRILRDPLARLLLDRGDLLVGDGVTDPSWARAHGPWVATMALDQADPPQIPLDWVPLVLDAADALPMDPQGVPVMLRNISPASLWLGLSDDATERRTRIGRAALLRMRRGVRPVDSREDREFIHPRVDPRFEAEVWSRLVRDHAAGRLGTWGDPGWTPQSLAHSVADFALRCTENPGPRARPLLRHLLAVDAFGLAWQGDPDKLLALSVGMRAALVAALASPGATVGPITAQMLLDGDDLPPRARAVVIAGLATDARIFEAAALPPNLSTPVRVLPSDLTTAVRRSAGEANQDISRLQGLSVVGLSSTLLSPWGVAGNALAAVRIAAASAGAPAPVLSAPPSRSTWVAATPPPALPAAMGPPPRRPCFWMPFSPEGADPLQASRGAQRPRWLALAWGPVPPEAVQALRDHVSALSPAELKSVLRAHKVRSLPELLSTAAGRIVFGACTALDAMTWGGSTFALRISPDSIPISMWIPFTLPTGQPGWVMASPHFRVRTQGLVALASRIQLV